MNVSLSNLNKQYQVHYQRSAIDTFTRQQTMQNGMIDLYVRGNNSVAYSEIYSSFAFLLRIVMMVVREKAESLERGLLLHICYQK